MLELIDLLDIASESSGLNAQDRGRKAELQIKVQNIDTEQEIKWFQRSKEKDILEEDNNTSYFMARANGRRRKTRIFSLQSDEGLIEGDKNLLVHATNFYKSLFGPNETIKISLHVPFDTVLDNIDKEMLIDNFTLDEIKTAIYQMDHNKTLGPDGFPAEFFQKFWV